MACSHRPACNQGLAASAAAAPVSNPATRFLGPRPPAPTWIAEVRSCTQSVFRVSACSLQEPTAWALSMAAVRHCLVFLMASLQADSSQGGRRGGSGTGEGGRWPGPQDGGSRRRQRSDQGGQVPVATVGCGAACPRPQPPH